jgi:hypothetical protein
LVVPGGTHGLLLAGEADELAGDPVGVEVGLSSRDVFELIRGCWSEVV